MAQRSQSGGCGPSVSETASGQTAQHLSVLLGQGLLNTLDALNVPHLFLFNYSFLAALCLCCCAGFLWLQRVGLPSSPSSGASH